MKYVYPVIFTQEDNKYLVSVPDLSGCHTFVGRDQNGARRNGNVALYSRGQQRKDPDTFDQFEIGQRNSQPYRHRHGSLQKKDRQPRREKDAVSAKLA